MQHPSQMDLLPYIFLIRWRLGVPTLDRWLRAELGIQHESSVVRKRRLPDLIGALPSILPSENPVLRFCPVLLCENACRRSEVSVGRQTDIDQFGTSKYGGQQREHREFDHSLMSNSPKHCDQKEQSRKWCPLSADVLV